MTECKLNESSSSAKQKLTELQTLQTLKMVLAFIQQLETAQVLMQSASALAVSLQKSFVVLSFVQNKENIQFKEIELQESLLKTKNLSLGTNVIVHCAKLNDLAEVCEELDASFLFLQLSDSSSKSIRSLLNACRDLRIPYLLYKDSFSELNMTNVLLPVGFLEEELEKAQFASAFGRFCKSHISMLLANDYGSKAAVNATKMQLLFDKFQLKYSLQKAKKDSFKVEEEAIQIAESENAGLIVVSASRDYGLDDILFGPKEYHVVKKSPVPVLLVNPRGDLYALCD